MVGNITPHEKRLLYEEILGCDAEGQNFSLTKASRDPFKRSMAYWLVKDYNSALTTLLETDIGRPRIAKTHEPIASDMEAYFRYFPLCVLSNYAVSNNALSVHPAFLNPSLVAL